MSFDTRHAGTSEKDWQSFIDSAPEWRPPHGPLVIVAPHPDDETLGAGGMLSMCSRLPFDITVVSVTDGERARAEIPELGRARIAELDAALSRLTPGAVRRHRLQLPDGDVARHERELTDRLEEIAPPHATLVGPFELDGHTDHDATGRACRALAAKRGTPLARYPIWAWHRLRPDAFAGMKTGKVRLDDRARAAKSEAIDCFVSQTEERPGGAIVPEHVLAYFRRSHEVYLL